MKSQAVLLAAALGAALTVSPASAHTCTASATQPTPSAGGATGSGTHSCSGPEYRDMSIAVCLEVATATTGVWSTYGCQVHERAGTRIVFGSATYNVCAIPGALLVRTTAYGMTSVGEHDYAESLPVSAVCSAT